MAEATANDDGTSSSSAEAHQLSSVLGNAPTVAGQIKGFCIAAIVTSFAGLVLSVVLLGNEASQGVGLVGMFLTFFLSGDCSVCDCQVMVLRALCAHQCRSNLSTTT